MTSPNAMASPETMAASETAASEAAAPFGIAAVREVAAAPETVATPKTAASFGIIASSETKAVSETVPLSGIIASSGTVAAPEAARPGGSTGPRGSTSPKPDDHGPARANHARGHLMSEPARGTVRGDVPGAEAGTGPNWRGAESQVPGATAHPGMSSSARVPSTRACREISSSARDAPEAEVPPAASGPVYNRRVPGAEAGPDRRGAVGRPAPARPWRGKACRLAAVTLLGLVGAFATPGTAAAHGETGTDDTNYRVTITNAPRIPGVTVRVVEAGARLELVNDGPEPVEVLGYEGEPFAEVGPDGVRVNDNSPATYLNGSSEGEPVPEGVSALVPPDWRPVTDEPALRWHDHRAHWMSDSPPPRVASAPDRDQHITDWTVPLRVGTTSYEITGSLDWVAPPPTSTWVAGGLLMAAVLAASAVALTGRRAWRPVVASAAVVAGGAALIDGVGRAVVGADAEAAWWQVLLSQHAWPVVAGLALLAAAGYAALGKPAADLALALSGASVVIVCGLSRYGVFTGAITATPWTADYARASTLLAVAVGAGLAASTMITTYPRRTGTTPPE